MNIEEPQSIFILRVVRIKQIASAWFGPYEKRHPGGFDKQPFIERHMLLSPEGMCARISKHLIWFTPKAVKLLAYVKWMYIK